METENLTLPTSGKIAVVKKYVTGLIDQEIRKIQLAANKTHYETTVDSNLKPGQAAQATSPTKVIMDVDPTVKITEDNKWLELMVESIGGEAENILDKVLALPKEDVEFILNKIKGIKQDSNVEGSDPKVPTV